MEYFNNRVAVTRDDMNGILAERTLVQMAYRGTIQVLRRGCRNTQALYALDSFRKEIRDEVYRRYPDFAATAAARSELPHITTDGEAVRFFADYIVEGDRHIPEEKAKVLANDAALFNYFRIRLDESDAEHRKVSKPCIKREVFWKKCAEALDVYADEWPNDLPRNWRRLQEKFRAYVKDGYPSLISGKWCNKNSSKIITDEQKAVVIALCSLYTQLDNAKVALEYNIQAQQYGWPYITPAQAARMRGKYRFEIDAFKNGKNEFSNTMAMQITRRKTDAAMMMLSLDGWVAEFYYQKRTEKGIVSYNNRVILEVVIDVCCGYPLGYAIADTEDSELIRAALKDAANETYRLFGKRYISDQVQMDHHGIKKCDPYYSAIADKITPARVKNAKSKPIERWFRDFRDKYGYRFPNYAGPGVRSKNGQPSSEWLNANKKNFPDRDGVVKQIIGLVAAMRAELREQYMQCWSNTPDEYRVPMSDERFLLAFGDATGRLNTMEPQGLRLRIPGRGERSIYDCFDIGFRQHADKKWKVLYDDTDLSHVLAVSENGEYRYLLEEKPKIAMVLAEQKEGEAEYRAKVDAFNKEMYQHAESVIRGHFSNLPQNTALINPDLHNANCKALITDSKGEHKNNREAETRRLLEGQTVTADGNILSQPKEKKSRKKALVAVPVDYSIVTEYEEVGSFEERGAMSFGDY